MHSPAALAHLEICGRQGAGRAWRGAGGGTAATWGTGTGPGRKASPFHPELGALFPSLPNPKACHPARPGGSCSGGHPTPWRGERPAHVAWAQEVLTPAAPPRRHTSNPREAQLGPCPRGYSGFPCGGCLARRSDTCVFSSTALAEQLVLAAGPVSLDEFFTYD